MSAFFAHESSLGRKFSILRRFIWMHNRQGQVNVDVNIFCCENRNLCEKISFFIGKSTAFSTKTPCNMQQNAVRFAAKCSAFCC